jgi:glycosyltransferase involved in cell wall biosynthesis
MVTKIMYLMDHYWHPYGGTERQLLQLIQLMDQSRYEPAITFLRSTEYIERNGFACPVRVLGITKLASIRSMLKVLRFALSLRRENYRLVHCFFNDSSLIALFLKLFGMRVVVSRRDMGFWYTPQNLAIFRLAAPFVDHYVANSQAVKRVVQQREWVPGEKISVIYNGYVPRAINDGEAASASGLPDVPSWGSIVGIVANLSPVKRVDTLIEAFALIGNHYPNAHLVIVGGYGLSPHGGSMHEELEGLATRLGVRERVIFIGLVEDPEPYINRFTVAVLCSESEGFSNSLIEYMQAGRPIVCTDTGGNPELVQDGRNGFLVPVGDAKALADRLVRLLSDSALARRLGEAARDTVRATYTHMRMVTDQTACYDEVLLSSRSEGDCGSC